MASGAEKAFNPHVEEAGRNALPHAKAQDPLRAASAGERFQAVVKQNPLIFGERKLLVYEQVLIGVQLDMIRTIAKEYDVPFRD